MRMNIILILILILNNPLSAQTWEQIDSLLLKTHTLNHKDGNTKGAIDAAFKAIKLSKKLNYEKGLCQGNYIISVILSDSQNFEKSNEYINRALHYKDYLKTDKATEFNLLILQSANFYELGLNSLAESYFKKAQKAALEVQDNSKQKYYMMILLMKSKLSGADEEELYKNYLQAKYINSQKLIFKSKISDVEILVKKGEICEKIGNYHFDRNNLDSAKYYYNKVLDVGNELNSDFAKAIAYASTAKVLEEEKRYKEALSNLTEAEKIFSKSNISQNLEEIYKLKLNLYDKLGDLEKHKEYFEKHKSLSDSLNILENKGRDKIIIGLVNEKEQAIAQSEKNFNYRLILIIGLSGLVILSGILYILKTKKKKKKMLIELADKETAVQELEQKVNEAFDEVLQMAKANHPQFWQRFQEVYPEFAKKLLDTSPDLKVSELSFCAYLYLGFTTKEIADYTFKTIGTVKNYRSSLRKKLGLSTSENISNWLQTYIKIGDFPSAEK